jgi:predicted AAA+ superfamily ATPase
MLKTKKGIANHGLRSREAYIGRIAPFVGNSNAKVVTGVRRSGKSTLIKGLLLLNTDCNILLYDMEFWSNRKYRDPDILYRSIKESLDPGRTNVLIIDEVQDVNEWEELIRSLIAERCCDIYITGSNSKLLSGEFATYLGGRINTIQVCTLSLRECILFDEKYGSGLSDDGILEKLFRVGGFPSVWVADYQESDALSEIRDIVQSILMMNVVRRYKVKRADVLESILMFMCDNIGNVSSLNSMARTLSSSGKGVNKDLVYEYAGYLEAACLVDRVETYDVKGKDILTSKYKYYLADVGIRNALLGFRASDIPGYIENIIYLDLKSRGYRIWVGNNNGMEVDFIAMKEGKPVYIQATTALESEDVVNREFGNLKGIDDNYPKYVVVLNKGQLDSDIDGIHCIGLKDFLLLEDLQRP